MTKNQNKIKDQFSVPNKKRKSQKSTGSKGKKSGGKDFSKLRKGFGQTFILFAVFLFIALISYLFTGNSDYDIVAANGFHLFDTI